MFHKSFALHALVFKGEAWKYPIEAILRSRRFHLRIHPCTLTSWQVINSLSAFYGTSKDKNTTADDINPIVSSIFNSAPTNPLSSKTFFSDASRVPNFRRFPTESNTTLWNDPRWAQNPGATQNEVCSTSRNSGSTTVTVVHEVTRSYDIDK